MQISISSNLAKFRRSIEADAKQVPYAIMLAVNSTMTAVAVRVTSTMPHYIDRPIPFTQRAFLWSGGRFKGIRATKARPSAALICAPIQNNYLRWIVSGGHEIFPKGHPVPGPTYPLNAYGNLPRRATKASGTFNIRTKGGKSLTYRRVGGKMQLVAEFIRDAGYKRTFPFYDICRKTAARRFPMEFRLAMRRAIKTAK